MPHKITNRTTRIVEKYLVTVPPEFRDLYDLRVGDLLEWSFEPENQRIVLTPKRAQLLTPDQDRRVEAARAARAEKAKLQANEPKLSHS
jgi:bifunctional DNA-binding transcriptional regulator/antitoxin component of YhaV-PrlF toxin-antitoxin module